MKHGRAVMPWGKWKGTQVRHVPSDYLSWLWGTVEDGGVLSAPEWRWVKDSVEAEMRHRGLNVPKPQPAQTPLVCPYCDAFPWPTEAALNQHIHDNHCDPNETAAIFLNNAPAREEAIPPPPPEICITRIRDGTFYELVFDCEYDREILWCVSAGLIRRYGKVATWDSATLPMGVYTITVTAKNAAGDVFSKHLQITVAEEQPQSKLDFTERPTIPLLAKRPIRLEEP
jgi:hypothetical protein